MINNYRINKKEKKWEYYVIPYNIIKYNIYSLFFIWNIPNLQCANLNKLIKIYSLIESKKWIFIQYRINKIKFKYAL